jgi:hypothetical protein
MRYVSEKQRNPLMDADYYQIGTSKHTSSAVN